MVPVVGWRESGGIPADACRHGSRSRGRNPSKEKQAADHEGTGPSSRLLRRNSPAGPHVSAHSLGIERTAALHSHRIHASRHHRQQPRPSGSRRRSLSLRGPVFRHAHGLGAAGRRAAEVGFPLFQPDRLQQLSLARRADRQRNAAASRKRPSGSWTFAWNWGMDEPGSFPPRRKAVQPRAWPIFTTGKACRLPLYKAHAALDRAVDRCYRSQPFTSDRQRIEFLFSLYERSPRRFFPRARRSNRTCSRSWASSPTAGSNRDWSSIRSAPPIAGTARYSALTAATTMK